jgi:hypothetical protein
MAQTFINPRIINRLDELILEGERQWTEFLQKKNRIIEDPVSYTKWKTSCLNLLDKLSISTNRFVKEFELWTQRGTHKTNVGAALGVLKAAKDEYLQGFAIDYHLGVAATVFGDLQQQAVYLFERGYFRAAVVLADAALEEAMKVRAKSIPVEMSGKETLVPLIQKLKSPDINVLTEFQARQLEAIAKMRNDAAHGGEFNYTKNEVERSLVDVSEALRRILGER